MIEGVNLEDVCDIIAGQSPPSSTYNQEGNGVPFFQGKADFGEIYPTVRYWCNSPKKMSKPDDILFSVRAPVGPTNINNITACIGRGLAAIRCNKIERNYLLHYLRGNEEKIASLGSGSTFKAITIGTLKELKIPLPPLEQQKKIATILDAADAYRQKTKALIEKYDELKQSLFINMFGDLRKYPKEAMKDAVNFIDYRGKSPNKVDSGIPLLTAKNVKVGYISEKPREYIPVEEYEEWMVRGFPKTGNVLFTTEAPLGQAALLPHYEKVAIAQRLICFQPNESLDSNYLLHTILSPLFQAELNRRATGSTAKGIRSKELAKIEIPIPPLNVQKEFNERVQAIEAQKAKAQESLAKAEDLFNSLLQRAFKGELV